MVSNCLDTYVGHKEECLSLILHHFHNPFAWLTDLNSVFPCV